MAIEWKQQGFPESEAIQWANIQVHIDLAKKLKDLKVNATEVSNFLTNGYSLDESVEWAIKRFTFKTTPRPNSHPETRTYPTATE
ncbi:hypothetical protein DSO57_1004242 [Entomophthora muscae]|uniref:Uncharacterized protein n=1 Tax=Entomophthora muscae TaxID=34485 RepID=A0ACC2SA37_9FUNG|nr:hypothetical protein DSO57_1004242 [Entomophthora muscae]